MTNFEFYKEEILNLINSGRVVAKANGKIVSCGATKCSDCDFKGNCERNRFTWLYAEYFEKPMLNKYERALCQALYTGWIARNLISNEVWWYEEKPIKDDECWYTKKKVGSGYINFSFYSVMNANPKIKFDFIKWNDDEPWSVKELLKLEVRE